MLIINAFCTNPQGNFLIAIRNTNTETVTRYLVRQDFLPFPLIDDIFPAVEECEEVLDSPFEMGNVVISYTEEVGTREQLYLLLSAKEGAAKYPDGFRNKLQAMKNTIEEKNEFLNGINNFVYVDSLLQLAKEYPKEIREFIHQCRSSNFIKSFSKELLQVMNGEKKLFTDLSKIARLYPDMFKTFLKDSTYYIPDGAPTVPRPI